MAWWFKLGAVFLVFLSLVGEQGVADCISLIKGPIHYDVRSCGVLNPEASFDTSKENHRFIKELPPRERKKFLNSYRGLIMSGQVARSRAQRSGLAKQKGVLNGEKVKVFVHPKDIGPGVGCDKLRNKRLKALLEEACCEGGGDPPCLLNSSYVLKNISVTKGSPKRNMSSRDQKLRKSKLYKEANRAFGKKQWSKAAVKYKALNSSHTLNVRTLYRWGLANRKADRCNKAIVPLKIIEDRQQDQDYWAEDAPFIRKANFLLARCYSKLNQPEMAVPILEAYLIDSRKYRSEIKGSLEHDDFGWIRTSQPYQSYKKKAVSSLR